MKTDATAVTANRKNEPAARRIIWLRFNGGFDRALNRRLKKTFAISTEANASERVVTNNIERAQKRKRQNPFSIIYIKLHYKYVKNNMGTFLGGRF